MCFTLFNRILTLIPLPPVTIIFVFFRLLLAHGISAIKQVEDKMWHQSVISENS